MNYLAILSVRAKTHRIRGAVDDPHAEDILVEEKRAIEVGHLQTHSAEVRRLREPVTLGPNSFLLVRSDGHLLRCHLCLHSTAFRRKCYAPVAPSSCLCPGQNVLIVAKMSSRIRIPWAASVSTLG